MIEYEIVLTRSAALDLFDIEHYIKFSIMQADIAERFISGILQKLSLLKTFPNRYPRVDDEELSNRGIRSISFKTHLIFYKVDIVSKKVIILRIGYTRRNWNQILKNEN